MLGHALRLRPRLASPAPRPVPSLALALSLQPSAAAGPSMLLPRRALCASAPLGDGVPGAHGAKKREEDRTRRARAIAQATRMQKMLAAAPEDPAAALAAAQRASAKLDALAAAEPTVDDLLALQPEERVSPRDPGYAAAYAEAAGRVDKAFRRAQLQRFARALGLADALGDATKVVRGRKHELVARILASWGWPRPRTPDKAYAHEFPMSSATLFHLQRRPELLAWLERLPGTHVAVVPARPEAGGGYVLCADGPRAVLDAVGGFLHDFVNSLSIAPLPAPLEAMPPAVRWAVAQATGAWIDDGGATGLAPEVARARAMLARVAAQLAAPPPPLTLLAHDGAFSLLPHVPAPSSPLPLAEAARARARTLFRLSGPAPAPDGERIAALPVLGTGAGTGAGKALAALVPAPDRDGGATLARFGHHLLPSAAGAGAGAGAASLAPPLAGAHALAPGSPLAALATTGTVFSPALPPTLVRFPLPERARRRRRVTYALPAGETLVVEATYPPQKPLRGSGAGGGVASKPAAPAHEPHWTELLDQQLKGGGFFSRAGTDAGTDALGRFLAEEDEDGDLVDEILGASAGDIDRLIEGASGAGGAGAAGADAHGGETAEGAELAELAAPEGMLDVSARVEGAEVLTDVALPWKPVDVRLVARARAPAPVPVPAPLADFFARAARSAPYVAGLALDDVAGLRRGAPPSDPSASSPAPSSSPAAPPAPAPPAPAPPTADSADAYSAYDAYGGAADVDVDPLGAPGDEAYAHAHAHAHAHAQDGIPPAPLAPAPPEPALTPPAVLRIGGQDATLLSDEVLDVVESTRPGTLGAPGSPGAAGPRPTLRAVSAVDLASPGPVLRYAELEGEGLWDEIDSVARAVGPYAVGP